MLITSFSELNFSDDGYVKDPEQLEEEYRDVMAKKSYWGSIYIPVIISYILAIAVYAYVCHWSKLNGALDVPHNPKIINLSGIRVESPHYGLID